MAPSIAVLACLLQAWPDSAGLLQAGQGCNRWCHNACLASAENGNVGDDNKIPNTAKMRAVENYDHVTLAGRESLGDFSTEKTEFC